MKINNYTQVSNQFIESMHTLDSSSVKVFLAISRKTIGWHKVSDRISYSQLQNITGLSVNTLKKAIKELVGGGWITQTYTEVGYVYDLMIDEEGIDGGEKNFSVSKFDTKNQNLTGEGVKFEKFTGSKFDRTKETITKDNTKEKGGVSNYDTVNTVVNNKRKYKRKISNPDVEEVIRYFNEHSYEDVEAEKFYDYYNSLGWVDSYGNKVYNWKHKALKIWFPRLKERDGNFDEFLKKYGKPIQRNNQQ